MSPTFWFEMYAESDSMSGDRLPVNRCNDVAVANRVVLAFRYPL